MLMINSHSVRTTHYFTSHICDDVKVEATSIENYFLLNNSTKINLLWIDDYDGSFIISQIDM